MLLEHRADVNALNFNGETPLDTAISAAMKASSVMARAGGHFSSSAALLHPLGLWLRMPKSSPCCFLLELFPRPRQC
jgi:hypothetical protein